MRRSLPFRLPVAGLALAALLAVPTASHAQVEECTSLHGQFNNFRRAFEADMDAQAAQMASDIDLFGFNLSEETVLQGLDLVHRYEQAHESWLTSLGLGPQLTGFNGSESGSLTKAGPVGGERTWMTVPSNQERNVRVQIRKTDGRAETDVWVCRWDADNNPTIVRHFRFPNGNRTSTEQVTLTDLQSEQISIHLVNNSFSNNFRYTVTTSVAGEYGLQQQSAGQVVDTYTLRISSPNSSALVRPVEARIERRNGSDFFVAEGVGFNVGDIDVRVNRNMLGFSSVSGQNPAVSVRTRRGTPNQLSGTLTHGGTQYSVTLSSN